MLYPHLYYCWKGLQGEKGRVSRQSREEKGDNIGEGVVIFYDLLLCAKSVLKKFKEAQKRMKNVCL